MRVFEAWRLARLKRNYADTQEARLAFYAGARHAMSELIEHLDGTEETTQAAYRLNDEITEFAKVAMLDH